MIIKSHIRGGYRAAAEYLKAQGKNEKVRLVEISDPDAKTLDQAFHNMWVVASCTKATKPLHHISINPMWDERLTDKQVLAIVERCEKKYGYRMFQHQRVIIEHVKEGRQHFHVIWNRVNMHTTETIWPGQHWKKSKQVCREMERELGLKTFTPRRNNKRSIYASKPNRTLSKAFTPTQSSFVRLKLKEKVKLHIPSSSFVRKLPEKNSTHSALFVLLKIRPKQFMPVPNKPRRKFKNISDAEKFPFRRVNWDRDELLAWAWETNNFEVLSSFGI